MDDFAKVRLALAHGVKELRDDGAQAVDAAYVALSRIEADNRRLREALEPFAHAGKHAEFYIAEALPDDICFPNRGAQLSEGGPTPFSLRLEDFRRALEALTGASP